MQSHTAAGGLVPVGVSGLFPVSGINAVRASGSRKGCCIAAASLHPELVAQCELARKIETFLIFAERLLQAYPGCRAEGRKIGLFAGQMFR